MQIPDGTPTDMGVCFVPLSCSFDGVLVVVGVCVDTVC